MKTQSIPEITPVAEHPDVRAIEDKANELRHSIADDTRRIEELSRPESETGAAVAERTRETVAAILDSGAIPEHAVTDRDSMTSEFTRRRRLRREALAMAETRIREVRARVGAEVIESLRPTYAALVEEMASGVYALGRLADREQAFRRALEEAGVSSAALSPMPLAGSGIEDDSSRASLWLAEAARLHGVRIPELEKLRTSQRERAERAARQEAAEVQRRREREEAEKRAELKRREKAAADGRRQREQSLLNQWSQPREGA